jgi:NitT/TauT family transport system substrate-binding protein
MPAPATPLPAPVPRHPRRRARRVAAALTAGTVVAVLAACGSAEKVTTLGVEKPDLTVAVVPAISAAGLYIAQQRGYFTAAGLNVKIVPIASGVNAIPDLLKGSVDIDEGQWAADLAAQSKGIAKLHALASASAGGPGVQEIVVPSGSPVTTVSQLRGKTIAVNALNGLAVLVTDIMLAMYDVPVSSVHYVVMGFPDMGAALAAHQVDAAFIAEPSLSAAEDQAGATPLFDVDQGPTHNIPISGYVVTQAWARKYPRTAAAFTRALEHGQRVAGTSRSAVQDALVPALHISKTTAAMMALGTFPLSVNSTALARVANLMKEHGLLGASVSTTALVKELISQ